MRMQVKKWGNSAAVRIPSSVISAAALKIDQTVEIREDAGRIIIEPIAAPVYDLNSLLDQMDDKTTHSDVGFGKPVGKETW